MPPQPCFHLLRCQIIVFGLGRAWLGLLLSFDEPLDCFFAGVPPIDGDGFQFKTFESLIDVGSYGADRNFYPTEVFGSFSKSDESLPVQRVCSLVRHGSSHKKSDNRVYDTKTVVAVQIFVSDGSPS